MRILIAAVVVLALAAATAIALRGGTSRSAPNAPQVETVAAGLEIPWALDFTPDGRMLVTERPGRIRVLRGGRLESQPWATLPVAHVGEGGLLGLAVSPDFSRTGFVYVYYTYEQDGRLWNRVVRMVERDGRSQVDRTIIDRIPGGARHDGGRIKFGPDGKLYIGTGETGQRDLAQELDSLAGKILRVNPDGSIPSDNPFPNSPVYSYGHRNVQGLAWHPETRVMFASEHGPSGELGCCHDEINIIEPGGNYGWPVVAGAGEPIIFWKLISRRHIGPLVESGAGATWAPSGIAIPSSGPWRNSLLMAALRGAQLRRFVLQPPEFRRVVDQEAFFQNLGRLRDVVQGPDGTLYILTNNRDGRGRPGPADDRILNITFR